MNLIASTNPSQYMSSNYEKLFTDIKKRIGTVEKLENEYETKKSLWQSKYDMLEKRITNEDDLSREQSDMMDNMPKLVFPDECQINTKSHIMKYAKHMIYNTKSRPSNNLTNENISDLHVTNDFKLALLTGVSVYENPNITSIDSDYLDTSLNMTSQKKIECLIADSSICHGTDYAFGGAIIDKSFSDAHSLNMIYQLMSRPGRGRKSGNAEIYIDETCAIKILNTIKLTQHNYNSTESRDITNMINVFKNLREI
jgi:hypothetical protein